MVFDGSRHIWKVFVVLLLDRTEPANPHGPLLALLCPPFRDSSDRDHKCYIKTFWEKIHFWVEYQFLTHSNWGVTISSWEFYRTSEKFVFHSLTGNTFVQLCNRTYFVAIQFDTICAYYTIKCQSYKAQNTVKIT